MSGIAGMITSPPPSTQKKNTRKSIANTPAKELFVPDAAPSAPQQPSIKSLFETAYTVDEERVIAIIANLRCKSKWDNKEKINKQATVITDLRAALKTCFDETKALKDKAVDVEANLTMTLQRVLAEMAVTRQQVAMLSKEDVRLKQEIKELTDTIKGFQNEQSELRQKLYEAETKHARVQEDLAALEVKRDAREHDFDSLQDAMIQARADSQEALATLKAEYEQVHSLTYSPFTSLHMTCYFSVLNSC